ncbi:MAG: dihydropteroate synthase [Azoarcus sp.]|jgi:dihydropteroate synthase|nr:dihydropteroate synthase [Azoarcus sp.]
MPTFLCGRFELDVSMPKIMAIINLTDDSFSGDGLKGNVTAVLRRAEKALKDGADILDLGAESTRPGSHPVPVAQETDRIMAAVEALRPFNVPLSADTMKPAVMQAALAAGADIINDIAGFEAPGAIDAVAGSACGLCVMHMQGKPRTMQHNPHYDDVVTDVAEYLASRVRALTAAGVAYGRIVLDPGFGFGKSVAHNYSLLKHLGRFAVEGLPILAGLSRKSMLGAVTGAAVENRLIASVTAAVLAVERGARIVRVHDVAATSEALKIWQAGTSEYGALP